MKQQGWLGWAASYAGYAVDTAYEIGSVAYNVTLRDYEKEPIDDVSEEISELIEEAGIEVDKLSGKDNLTDHERYIEFRPQLLKAIDGVISRAGEVKNNDLESYWGIGKVVGNQLFHPVAFASTILGGGVLFNELSAQVTEVQKAKNNIPEDKLGLANASVDEILHTPIMTEILQDKYVWDLLEIKKDSFENYIKSNNQFLKKYIASFGKPFDYGDMTDEEIKKFNNEYQKNNFHLTQICFENPKALKTITNLLIDLQPNFEELVKDPEVKSALKFKSGIDGEDLVKDILPNAAVIFRDLFENLEDKNAFYEFIKENDSALRKLMGAQKGEETEISSEEFEKLNNSLYNLLIEAKADKVLIKHSEALNNIVITYFQQYPNETFKTFSLQEQKNNNLTDFGKATVSLAEKMMFAGLKDNSLENGKGELAKFITDLTYGETDITESSVRVLDWMIDKFSNDPALEKEYSEFMRNHGKDIVDGLNNLFVGNRHLKGKGKEIFNLIKDKNHLSELVEIYGFYRDGKNLKLFTSMVSNGNLMAVVVQVVIESVKYVLRESIFPDSIRRLLLNGQANELLNEPKGSPEEHVDLAEHLLEFKLEKKPKGIKGFMIDYKSFKGLIIKHELKNMDIDGFNFNNTKFESEKFVLENCNVKNTTFENIKASKFVIKNCTLDSSSFLSLTSSLEKAGITNIEIEEINVSGLTNPLSQTEQKNLKTKLSDLGGVGKKLNNILFTESIGITRE